MNEKQIYPAYKNSVLSITSTDMVITLEIPEINTKVVYTHSSFTIDLPYSSFGGNTEGQCGELAECSIQNVHLSSETELVKSLVERT